MEEGIKAAPAIARAAVALQCGVGDRASGPIPAGPLAVDVAARGRDAIPWEGAAVEGARALTREDFNL